MASWPCSLATSGWGVGGGGGRGGGGGGRGGGGGGGRKHAQCSHPNRRLFQVVSDTQGNVYGWAGIHLFHKPITDTVPIIMFIQLLATSDSHQQELHSCDD